jgi:2-methylisocitrate lyase-like PEP mutase family enzyme
MNPGSQLREVFSASEMQIIVPIYDGLSMRLAELCGFKACMLGGSTVTNTMLGLPDWCVRSRSAICRLKEATEPAARSQPR